jgi:glycosyltransferase involved in cell wall biosynthesis
MTDQRLLRIMLPAALAQGGAERQALLLAEHLPRDRFDVTFVSLLRESPWSSEARRVGATVHDLEAPRRAGTALPRYALTVAGRVGAYVALCRRERYDIVDAWLYLAYALAAVTRPVARVPVLVVGRRSLGDFKDSFGLVERTVDGIARRAADVVVANSQAVADDTHVREGIARTRIRIIRNGVVIPAPDPERRARARARFEVSDGSVVVGCVGTFKPGKGQDRVLAAMGALWRLGSDAWLVFVGDGPERERVAAEAARAGWDRLRMLGTVEDARDLYDGFDVVVSASDAEGLPNVLLEAAAAARPIVATAAGGTPEIVLDGRTGILVPLGDVEALTAGLDRILGDPELASRLGGAARSHVAEAFGVERFVAETAALYEEMHERHGR